MKENAISDLADKCKVLKTYFGGEHLEDEEEDDARYGGRGG